MKGYTTLDNVAMQIGRTLTDPQKAYVTSVVLPAVEMWIDSNGAKSYGDGAVSSEQLVMSGPYAWLLKTPIQSLDAMRGWRYGTNASYMTTIDPLLYRMIRADIGQVYFPAWQLYAYIEADYTPTDEIPANITMAASILAGVFIRTVLHPQSEWLTEYASAQDVRVKFRDVAIPDIVMSLLGDTDVITIA